MLAFSRIYVTCHTIVTCDNYPYISTRDHNHTSVTVAPPQQTTFFFATFFFRKIFRKFFPFFRLFWAPRPPWGGGTPKNTFLPPFYPQKVDFWRKKCLARATYRFLGQKSTFWGLKGGSKRGFWGSPTPGGSRWPKKAKKWKNFSKNFSEKNVAKKM